MQAFCNASIITADTILTEHTLIYDEKIRAIFPDGKAPAAAAPFQAALTAVYDLAGAYLSPGFIDLHLHGCQGNDVMDPDLTALATISQVLPQTGVTGFLPTTMTMSSARLQTSLQHIHTLLQASPGAQVLGCNLEGPFLSPAYAGAQNRDYLRAPDFSLLQPWLQTIKLLTIAPELPGALELIRQCNAAGILVSIGHSGATYEETMAALASGASHFTHTFNAASPCHHRTPGVTGAALDSDAVCELIADNLHVHPALQRLLAKVKGVKKLVLITDAMRACLQPDGSYELGGQDVTVSKGEARLANGVLAGSILTLNQAIRNFIANTGLSLPAAVQTVSLTPATRLGIAARTGSIAVGKNADLTVFAADFSIQLTLVQGQLRYCKTNLTKQQD